MGTLQEGAGSLGPAVVMDSGGGSNTGLAGGAAGGGEALGKSPCASALPPRAGLGSPNSRAVAIEPAFGAGTPQAASQRGTRPGGVENLLQLGGGFDPQLQLIALQTWSCLLPRPPQGGGGSSLPLRGPRRRPWMGLGRGRMSTPTRGWPERGSEGRKLGKQSTRLESGRGNASAGGEGREGRACQPGWRPRAGSRY